MGIKMHKMNAITAPKDIFSRLLYIAVLMIVFLSTLNSIAAIIIKDSEKLILKEEEASLEKEDIDKLTVKNKKIKSSLSALLPKGNYIVVDTAKNMIYLKNGEEIIHKAVVSTGSGKVLTDPRNQDKKWIFDTPRGEFTVKTRKEKPIWVKPDWAFIEEGTDIPNKYNDRLEAGVLGDYALGIGNGYFIHGTLYTRLLGRSVTHGCVRVDDNDLKIIFNASKIGTKVYIF